MNVGKIGYNNIVSSQNFKGEDKKTQYENPVSRSTERNLAILKSTGESTLLGGIIFALTSCFGFKGKTVPIIAGVGTFISTMVFTLPANLYNTKVSAFAKQKEMDVFSRDRNLKSNLTEEVDKEVQSKDVSLDKKLDDNLKLQMANRGAAIGLANMTPQA